VSVGVLHKLTLDLCLALCSVFHVGCNAGCSLSLSLLLCPDAGPSLETDASCQVLVGYFLPVLLCFITTSALGEHSRRVRHMCVLCAPFVPQQLLLLVFQYISGGLFGPLL
jgi:hypothetical protein